MEKEYYVGNDFKKINIQTRSSGDGLYDLLGYGYDLFDGRFFHPASAKAKVIDTERFITENPGRYDFNLLHATDRRLITSINSTEYLKDLNATVDAGIELLKFRGALKGSYSQSEIQKSENSFASMDIDIMIKQIYVTGNKDLFKQYLTPDFIDDYFSMRANELIRTYGTHILTNITLGGRLNIVYKSVNTSSENEKKISVNAGFKSGLLKIFNLDISGSINQHHIDKNTMQEMVCKTQGGNYNSRLNTSLIIPYEQPKIDTENWITTCNTSNMVLINANIDLLIPITDLIPEGTCNCREIYCWTCVKDAMRKSELETAFSILKNNSQ